MKLKNLLTMMLVAIGLLGASNVMAQIAPGTLSEICEWGYTPNGVGGGTPAEGSNAYVLFTWETLPNGNVEIRIAPHPDNAGTGFDYACFRGTNGLATGGFSLTAGTFSSYFAKSLSSDKKTVVLTPIQVIPEGTIIKFNGQCEYKTTDENPTGNGNDLWPTMAFPDYTYGTNCSGEYLLNLDAPTDVSVSVSNVLSFTEVDNATSYSVMIKLGTTLIKSLTVAGSGETISTAPFSGNFEVTVIASDNTGTYANSNPSDAYIWASVATDETVGSSPICEAQFGDAGWGLFISIETATENEGNIQAGDIIFTLSGNGAGFRGQGAQLANITIDGVPGAGVLTKVSGNLDNPNVFRPISGLSIAKGASIVYNGEFEALSAMNGNIWGARTFNYVYGTACDAHQLAAPTNLAIDTDNILTFDGDPNAESHTVYVLYGETQLMTMMGFASGDEVVFPVNGTFTLKISSSTSSSDYANSELSEAIPFVMDIADQTVSDKSLYCEYNIPFVGELGTVGVVPNVSLETLSNGDISVTMNGDNVWRNNGINVNGWTIAGISAGSLLEKIGSADNPQIFRPKEGVSIPKGTLMSYDLNATGAAWEWGPGNGWVDTGGAILTDYVYGSICGELPEPVVFTAINASPNGNGICWTVNADILSQIDEFRIYKKEPESAGYPGDETFILHGTIEKEDITANGEPTFCYDLTSKTLLRAAVNVETYVAAVINGVEHDSDIVGEVPMIPTGISTPSVGKDAVKTQYFTIDGRQITEPVMGGIYLVKKTYEDGSVATEKVFRK